MDNILVGTGNPDQGLKAEAIGKALLTLNNGSKTVLNRLLLTPSISRCLLSLPNLLSSGVTICCVGCDRFSATFQKKNSLLTLVGKLWRKKLLYFKMRPEDCRAVIRNGTLTKECEREILLLDRKEDNWLVGLTDRGGDDWKVREWKQKWNEEENWPKGYGRSIEGMRWRNGDWRNRSDWLEGREQERGDGWWYWEEDQSWKRIRLEDEAGKEGDKDGAGIAELE